MKAINDAVERLGIIVEKLHSYPGIDLKVPLWFDGENLRFSLGDDCFRIPKHFMPSEAYFIKDTATTLRVQTLSEGIRYMEFVIHVIDFNHKEWSIWDEISITTKV